MSGNAGPPPVTLALTEAQFDELTSWLDAHEETAGVVRFRVTEIAGDPAATVTVRDVRRIGCEHYLEHSADGLTIESTGWVPGLAAADRAGDRFGFAHTHPGLNPQPWPSARDQKVDAALREAAAVRLPPGPYLSLIITGTPAAPHITGVLHSAGNSRPITRVRIVGDRLTILRPPADERGTEHDHRDAVGVAVGGQIGVFDRQVRAFGSEGQAVLEGLCAAVVGAGGTGSAVAVVLARLGIGQLVLIDPQALEGSNVPRVHGSTLGDVGQPKVAVLADHIRGLGLGTLVTAVRGDILDESTMHALLHADVVFGCTDDHAGRARLSRLPNRMTNLLLDIGVLIDGRDDVVLNVISRLTSVQPGGACLFCTGDVDPALVAAQEMTGEQRQRLAEEGYAPNLGDPDPAVVAFTTNIASAAVTELLDRLIGWTDHDVAARPNRVVSRLGSHRSTTETISPASPSHWCASPDHAGVGGGEPLLGLNWREPTEKSAE